MRYSGSSAVAVLSPPRELRVFGEREYVLEKALRCDFALVRAAKGDHHGNSVVRRAARNFNPVCAMAGRIAIAEVEESVEPGDIDPDDVHLPGRFVNWVVPVDQPKRIERDLIPTIHGAGRALPAGEST